MTSSEARYKGIGAFWVLMIVIPVTVVALWIAIDHSNAIRDRAQERTNQQFRQALIVTDRKFRQSLAFATKQFSFAHNSSVCTLRPFLVAARKARIAAVKTAKDEKDRALNQQAAKTYARLIASQVTVPSDFDCSTLPKKPPKARP